LLTVLRGSKDEVEIAAMVAAQRIAESALEELLGEIAVGMTEKEIAARLQYLMVTAGAEKLSFDTIVASGPNSSMPHAVPTERRIENGDFLTIDFGCVYHGYCSDMTRTFAVGSVSDEMRAVYDTVLEAQLAGIAAAKAGVSGKEIDGAAREVIEKAGYGPYFGHSFGHSLGIDIHENPNASPGNNEPMPVGAVISAEPGIYLPGRFGVRIEDVLVLEESGCRNITAFPKELLVI
jgi:Xaa-Pro aminopeptidase